MALEFSGFDGRLSPKDPGTLTLIIIIGTHKTPQP
jgi:hypothetical protein